jgi:hypothetical protein
MVFVDGDHDGSLVGRARRLTRGGGCGTSVSRPFGVKGVMTMKMMISTRSTSIIGVILTSDLTPLPPTDIPIKIAP